jgi:predicted nucleic acid-binding protein
VGLILDSSVVISGERRGRTVRQVLEQIEAAHGDVEMGLSVVSIVELVHGIERAKDEQRRTRRRAFVDELIRDVPVHPISVEIARRAGGIGGERAAQGITIAFEDLLIDATALHLGFAVATSNIGHFQVVPGLTVVAL